MNPSILGTLTLFAAAVGLTLVPLVRASVSGSSETFQGDRRPGILHEPSETPVGENADSYRFIDEEHDPGKTIEPAAQE